MALDATSDIDLSQKEAESTYNGHILRLNYKKETITYCTAIFLGKGSFGKVYKGWRNDGREHIAVKVIEQSSLDQTYNARENLDREISIMKLMKGCDNVVQIFNAMQVKGRFIITMEMCDGDLRKLLESKQSFTENDIVDFLHQLGEGMKELRKQNIVHRDIKPENILIKHREQRIVYKLADFGYARHFDASRSNEMMNSVVGTPIYMAPEALVGYTCDNQQAIYNDKADVWSIGALLYKVLVGQDAFPASLQIYQFLKEKQDNIAFELTTKKGKPTYLDELPIPVQRKLSSAFCHAITELLVGMLKFDEKERFSFPIFFEKIDDIIESKIELINLLHGTSVKLISDPGLTAHTLLMKASCTWNIPEDQVVIFSTVHPKYIGAHQQITAEEFASLVKKSGGQDGHAKLYVLTLQHLKVDGPIEPDMSCFEPLKSALDQHNTEYLIRNLRFMDEIMYMIQCLKNQLHNQRESVGKLYQFTINETGMSSSYNNLKKQVQQTLARVSLMLEILEKDLEWYGDGDEETLLPELMQELAKKEGELRELEMEFNIKTISLPEVPFHWKDSVKKINLSIDMMKKVQTGRIPNNCQELFHYCRDMIADTTRHTRLKLTAYGDVLESTWSLYSKSAIVEEIAELMVKIQSARQKLFEGRLRPSNDNMESFPSTFSMRNYTSMLQNLRHENDELRKKLTKEKNLRTEIKKQYDKAVASCKSSELAIKERNIMESERFSIAAIEKLNKQLLEFCRTGNRVLHVSKSDETQTISGSPAHGKGRSTIDEELLIKAKDLATKVCSSMSFMRKDDIQSAETHSDILVKISYPENYKAGDIVLMTPINTPKGSVPSVLHLKWKDPHILMDFRCLVPMGIIPGKVPQLFLAKLRDAPQKYNLEDYRRIAKDIGQTKGFFYRVNVEPVSIKFSDGDLTLLRQDEQHQPVTPFRGKRPPT